MLFDPMMFTNNGNKYKSYIHSATILFRFELISRNRQAADCDISSFGQDIFKRLHPLLQAKRLCRKFEADIIYKCTTV